MSVFERGSGTHVTSVCHFHSRFLLNITRVHHSRYLFVLRFNLPTRRPFYTVKSYHTRPVRSDSSTANSSLDFLVSLTQYTNAPLSARSVSPVGHVSRTPFSDRVHKDVEVPTVTPSSTPSSLNASSTPVSHTRVRLSRRRQPPKIRLSVVRSRETTCFGRGTDHPRPRGSLRGRCCHLIHKHRQGHGHHPPPVESVWTSPRGVLSSVQSKLPRRGVEGRGRGGGGRRNEVLDSRLCPKDKGLEESSSQPSVAPPHTPPTEQRNRCPEFLRSRSTYVSTSSLPLPQTETDFGLAT